MPTDVAASLPVTIDDVRAAAERLRGVAHRTPVLTSQTLDERTGAKVFLKCENFQRGGAFKFRGAYNRLSLLSPTERRGGVIAFSSGNHGQGVALAARLLGIAATVVMPLDAPAAKVAATSGYGAEIVMYDRAKEDRTAIAGRIAQERGATVVPPFDAAAIVAGAGTAALELLEDIPDLDVVVTPLGGGGLLSGTALAARAMRGDDIAVWGVEPEAGDDFRRSLEAGKPISIPLPATIADGLQTLRPGDITFAVASALITGAAVVSDAALREAMRFAFERLKIVIEPSGAAGIAGILSGAIDVGGKKVGVVISGGNVNGESFARILTGA